MVANGYGFNGFGKALLQNAEGDRRSVSNKKKSRNIKYLHDFSKVP